MADIFNNQRVLGVHLVDDGTKLYNMQPVIGVVGAADGALFVDNQRVLGVEVRDTGTIYNEQPVIGVVLIDDSRTLYNNQEVIPVSGLIAPGNVPVNTDAPTVAGDLTNGSTLTANPGTWTGSPTSYSVQWYRDSVAIGSPIVIAAGDPAPTRTYSTATDEGRALTIGVVATNADGSSIEVISPGRIGLYDPVVYSTTFAGATGTPLQGQDGWASNGGFNTNKLLVGPPLTMSDGLGGTAAAIRDTGSTIPRIRITPARNAGEDSSTSGRYYHFGAIDSLNYLAINIQSNGFNFFQRVANTYSDVGSEYGFVNDEGTEWEFELNTVASVRYIRVYRKAVGATEFTQTPGSIAANAGKGFGPFDAALNSATKAGIGGSVGWSAARPRHSLAYSVRVPAADNISLNISAPSISPVIDNQRVTLSGSYTGSGTAIEYTALDPNGFELMPWTAAPAISGGSYSFPADIPYAGPVGNITVYVRFVGIPSSAAMNSFTSLVIPMTSAARYGINVGFIDSELPFTDLVRQSQLYCTDTNPANGGDPGWKIVGHPSVTIDNVACESYRDASFVGATARGVPTSFPPGGGDLFLNHPVNYEFAWMSGNWTVECSPGLRWSINDGASNTAWSRPGYGPSNEAAGTGTVNISGSVRPAFLQIKFEGYDNGGGYVASTLPSNFFFRIKRPGETGLVRSDYKAAIAGLVGPNGDIRFMSSQAINRNSIVGMKWNPSDDGTPTGDDYKTFTAAMVNDIGANTIGQAGYAPGWALDEQLELVEAVGAGWYLHYGDLYTDGAITKIATFVYANKQPSTPVKPTNSNEEWNFGAPFRQSTLLNNRAIAAGKTTHLLYAQDCAARFALWSAVPNYDAANTEPVIEWQYASTSQAMATEMVAAFPASRHFNFGPYGSNGAGGYDASIYGNTAFMSAADRGLATTDVPLFKTKWNAAVTVANAATQARFWELAVFVETATLAAGQTRGYRQCGSYEVSYEHYILSGYSEPLLSNTSTALSEWMRSAPAGAQAVDHWQKIARFGGVQAWFDFAGLKMTVDSPKLGIWSVQDSSGQTTQEPAASMREFIAGI